jgi:hypothetical protein
MARVNPNLRDVLVIKNMAAAIAAHTKIEPEQESTPRSARVVWRSPALNSR